MKRIALALICLLLAGIGSLRADQTTAAVQRALKDQGFYYGDVNGQKTADTTAAIRRYQIRNGLQITGEIDAETLRLLGIGSSTARSTPQPQPATSPVEEDLRDASTPTQSAEIPGERLPPDYNPQRAPYPQYAPGPGGLRPEMGRVFA